MKYLCCAEVSLLATHTFRPSAEYVRVFAYVIGTEQYGYCLPAPEFYSSVQELVIESTL